MSTLKRFMWLLIATMFLGISGILVAACFNTYFVNFTLYLVVSAAVFFFLGLLILGLLFRRGGSSNHSYANTISYKTDYGYLSVSLSTIEAIALKAAHKIPGITEVQAKVQAYDTLSSISIRAFVDGENNIPQMVENLQKNVKSQIESIAGIEVAHVDVEIAGVQRNGLRTIR